MKKLNSLSIFFPFFNDEGTVEKQIRDAYLFGSRCAKDLEVMAIHGGKSKDKTWEKILRMKQKYPNLKILNKSNNTEGYAVIKYGLGRAKKNWVFYTDGDAQYHLNELPKLVKKQFETEADVVNGYKTDREDPLIRIFFGGAYRIICKFLFNLPIRDINCDYRLIRRSYLKKIFLVSRDAVLLPELIKKLEITGAKFAEVPVKHYQRIYGKSNFHVLSLTIEQILGVFRLYLSLRKDSFLR